MVQLVGEPLSAVNHQSFRTRHGWSDPGETIEMIYLRNEVLPPFLSDFGGGQ